jgi:ABC-2 type transport system permease protein
MRHVVFDHVHASTRVRAALLPPITWNGWSVPMWLELVGSGAIGVALLLVAVKLFSHTD